MLCFINVIYVVVANLNPASGSMKNLKRTLVDLPQVFPNHRKSEFDFKQMHQILTLKTNISPENQWLEDEISFLKWSLLDIHMTCSFSWGVKDMKTFYYL